MWFEDGRNGDSRKSCYKKVHCFLFKFSCASSMYVCFWDQVMQVVKLMHACIHRHEAAILLQVNNQTKSVEQKNTPGLNSSCKCFVCQRRRCIPDVKLTFQHFRWWYWEHSAVSTRYKMTYFHLRWLRLSAVNVSSVNQPNTPNVSVI